MPVPPGDTSSLTRTALVVTTIKVPEALEWYRQISAWVPFYVIGDDGAPDGQIAAFCERIGARYYSASDQRKLGYACSDLLRWRDPARRSIGCLEAVRDGAEIVVMADDDNLPLNASYFTDHTSALTGGYSGLTLTGDWVDPWQLLQPPVHHRGFPQQMWHPAPQPAISWATGCQVGVNAGAVLGDPDIDAAERIADAPVVTGASPLLNSGVALAPGSLSPFNAQNTAFRRELLPVMVMLSPAGRCLDIWAAYLAEKVMAATGWAVRYGRPFVWQQRNPHNLAEDAAAELRGMRETLPFCAALAGADVRGGSDVMARARAVHEHLARTRWADIAELGLAWLKDCEAVLG